MSGEINYTEPGDILAAVSITLGGSDPLVGLMTSFGIRSNGTHEVFPFAISGPSYNTYSVVRPSPGSLTFSGMLVGNATTLATLLAELGEIDYTTATTFQVVDPATTTNLLNCDLYDYRMHGVQMSMSTFGNLTIVRGVFSATYRKLVHV